MTSQVFTWVSPYHPDDALGGWKAMQHHLLLALEAKVGAAQRIAPVEVPEEFLRKCVSRICKKVRIPRRYVYYSDTRLDAFARAVQAQLPSAGRKPVIFFGALPFVKCRPAVPYYIYTDGAFFIHYWEYNQDHSHARSEIERICLAEAEFMQRAAAVWCSSQWVAERITKQYGLRRSQALFVGTGPGDVPPPAEPIRYEKFLVMITADFQRKRGRLAVDAVTEARKQGMDVGIKFIGAKPPADVLALPFVEWCGWLDLKRTDDRGRFAEVMSRAGAQILLSRADLTPLVIPEAARYGKATLATAVGGIPEMIRDGETGWLVRPDSLLAEIGERVVSVFSEKGALLRAGTAARSFCTSRWSWEAVAKRTLSTIPRITTNESQ
jgi:glycosyltransferase involved in cell wall biosynthesis